jgi:Rod binding domain-containing protein
MAMPTISAVHFQGVSSSTIPPRPATPAGKAGSSPGPAPGRSAKAAREFEAQLIGSVLASLEKTFAAVPGDDSISGSDDYNYLGVQALAGTLADHGGFGIGTMISRYLTAHERAVAPPAISPVVPPEPSRSGSP